MPEEMIEAIDASASLRNVAGDGQGEGCKTAEYFRSFLVLCKEGTEGVDIQPGAAADGDVPAAHRLVVLAAEWPALAQLDL